MNKMTIWQQEWKQGNRLGECFRLCPASAFDVGCRLCGGAVADRWCYHFSCHMFVFQCSGLWHFSHLHRLSRTFFNHSKPLQVQVCKVCGLSVTHEVGGLVDYSMGDEEQMCKHSCVFAWHIHTAVSYTCNQSGSHNFCVFIVVRILLSTLCD